jgi:hypothetical protein
MSCPQSYSRDHDTYEVIHKEEVGCLNCLIFSLARERQILRQQAVKSPIKRTPFAAFEIQRSGSVGEWGFQSLGIFDPWGAPECKRPSHLPLHRLACCCVYLDYRKSLTALSSRFARIT